MGSQAYAPCECVFLLLLSLLTSVLQLDTCLSLIRSYVRDIAEDKVPARYMLTALGSSRERLLELLSGKRYLYLGDVTVSVLLYVLTVLTQSVSVQERFDLNKAFLHECFGNILMQLVFIKRRGFCSEFHQIFEHDDNGTIVNVIPLSLIALIATAVSFCALLLSDADFVLDLCCPQ